MTVIQRTTITLPADLLNAAKTAAFHRKTSVSELVRKGLEEVIYTQPQKRLAKTTKQKPKKTPLEQFVGGRSLGFTGIKREKIYEDYLRKKVSA